MSRRVAIELCLVAGLGALVLGCATAGQRLDRLAAERGLEILRLDGGDFSLRAYARDRRPGGEGEVLHVYLEGDGRPWSDDGRRPSPDPHGESHLAFELMALDPSPVLYLKRPCYQRPENDAGSCHPALWTSARYSPTVVEAMAEAVRGHLAARSAAGVVWIGHSGGGVLASLLARRVQETVGLVTVAAPLDLAAWTELHGFEPLHESLDPAEEPPLGEDVVELHFAGARDGNVPPEIVRSGPGDAAGLVVVEEFDHVCCWREIWPEVLESLTDKISARAGTTM